MFTIVVVSIIIIVTIYVISLAKRQKNRYSPPGPYPYPLLGNFPQLGPVIHISLTKISQSFKGGIFQLHLMGRKIVIVNKAVIAKEVMISGGSDIGDRTTAHVIDVMSRNGCSLIFGKIDPTWKEQRKAIHSGLRYFTKDLKTLILKETKILIENIKNTHQQPFDPKLPITLCVMNIICHLVYGQRYDIEDQEFLQIIKNAEDLSEVASPKNPLILLPWLRYLPLKSVKHMKDVIKERDDIIRKKVSEHVKSYREGKLRDLTDYLLKSMYESSRLSQDHLEMAVSDVFLAGFETTTTTLRWILLYLVLYPQVQARIHKEIDDVMTGDQSLSQGGLELPYLAATINEVMRISPVFTLIRRRATRDFILRGFQIEKGTPVYVNSWAIHHDPDDWERPYEFRPKRFLSNEKKGTMFPFGGGVRLCVGKSLAQSELFLILSSLLYHFKFVLPDGTERPDTEGISSTVYWPKPFTICARERRHRWDNIGIVDIATDS